MRPSARIIARAITPQRWRNGGGETRELYTWPDPRHWRLRISLATIERAGPFSVFAGVQRRIAVIEGAGILLRINDETHRLTTDTEPLAFDGGAAAHCTPLGGATSDLNLMITHGQGEMLRALPGIPWISASPQRALFARIAGELKTDAGGSEPVPAGTLLWFEEAAGVAFTFALADAGPSTPAWWLGYDPSGWVEHKGGR
ncbi:MAG TPA: HutD family protein [Steroidobacteraceae bacterium]|nr:HutD family protein [Steroidobacteraceae bacterium]